MVSVEKPSAEAAVLQIVPPRKHILLIRPQVTVQTKQVRIIFFYRHDRLSGQDVNQIWRHVLSLGT